MKSRLMIFVLILFPGFLLTLSNPLPVFADCDIANWDATSRNLQVCVGKFDSPDQLRNTTANFHCLDNSNPGQGFCIGIENDNYNLSGTPDNQIDTDASGKYYTCITGQGLSRGIGRIEVIFSGSQNCTTESINTVPSDWNPLTEGTIFSGGTGGGSCYAGGDGTCSTSGSCDSATSTWHDLYSPIHSCLGSGGGCCVPKSSGNNGPSPLCGEGNLGVNTAIGCLMAGSPTLLITQILNWAVVLGIVIALLMIIFAGFQITTAAGDPKRVKAGQELITSAVAGLILIIFSIVLLNFVGVQLLNLPGFVGNPSL